MQVGQEGYVYGRKARLIRIFSDCIRVLFLEGTDRSKMLDEPFEPFEANVSKGCWTTRPRGG